MKRIFRISLRILLFIVLGMLLLFGTLWGLLQINSVQNFAVSKATTLLEKQLDTEVRIGRVDIDFFKTAVLEDLYLADQSRDTLVFAKRLGVDISVFSLLQKEIALNSVTLEGARIKLHRNARDSLFNFQFLQAESTAEEKVAKDTTAKGSNWSFSLDRIELKAIDFSLNDEVAQTELATQLGSLRIGIQNLDFDQNAYHIGHIDLEESKVYYEILALSPSQPIPFPEIPLSLKIDRLSLKDNLFSYQLQPLPAQQGFDPNHLFLSPLSAMLEDLSITPGQIAGEITSLEMKDQSGLSLSAAKAALLLTDTTLIVDQLELKTPRSRIALDAGIRYDSFKILTAGSPDMRVNLQIKPSNYTLSELAYFAPDVAKQLRKQKLLNTSVSFSGDIQGTIADLDMRNVQVRAPDLLKVALNMKLKGLPDPDQLQYSGRLRTFEIQVDKLKPFLPDPDLSEGLEPFERISMTGLFKGNQNKINGQNVEINTRSYTQFAGDFLVENLQNPEQLAFELDVKSLRTKATDFAYFIPSDTLQAQVDSLGVIQFAGQLSGTTKKFDVDGQLQTDIGSLMADAKVAFNADYSDADYAGTFSLDAFHLGKLLQDEALFGPLSLEIKADGSGLEPSEMQGDVDASIQSIVLNQYAYKDIDIEGRIDRQQFTGTFSIIDPNIQLRFDGLLEMRDSIPTSDFTLNIDTLQLKPLGWSEETFNLSAAIRADLKGLRVDDLDGQLVVADLHLESEQGAYQTDSITLTAGTVEGEKEIRLTSAFANMQMTGQYQIEEFPALAFNFVNDYFPMDQFLSEKDRPKFLALEPNQRGTPPDRHFDFLFELTNPVPLVSLFTTELVKLDRATLRASFDAQKRDWNLKGVVPDLQLASLKIDSILLSSKGDFSQLKNEIRLVEIQPKGTEAIAEMGMDVIIGNDQLKQRLFVRSSDGSTKLETSGKLTSDTTSYIYTLNPPFILNNEEWTLNDEHAIAFRSDYLNINQVSLQKNNQQFYFNSSEESEEDFAPITMGFKQFELDEISQLISFENAFYEGDINGEITVEDYLNDLHYLVDLNVKNIKLNQEPVGELQIKSSQKGRENDMDLAVSLIGEGNDVRIKGNYAIAQDRFDVNADINQLQTRLMDVLSLGQIKRSKGYLTGNAEINGSMEDLRMQGMIQTNELSTFVTYLGQRYTLENSKIRFDERQVDLGTIRMRDTLDYRAELSGQINIRNLLDPGLDLQFHTDRFTVLNTKKGDNELFYGQLVLALDIEVRGTVERPFVEVRRAKTMEGSRLTVELLQPEEVIADENFIIFSTPSNYVEDTTKSLNSAYSIEYLGLDLLLNLDLTEDAVLEFIVDPVSGDKLVVRGNANLTVNMDGAGYLQITGNYLIEEGTYSFSYERLVKRKFDINKGSRLVFVGNPLDTRFDITAAYKTKTTTYSLIKNQSTLSQSEIETAQRRTEVRVLMIMQGNIEEPQLSFDIRLPESQSGVTSSAVARKLGQIRENETELNKQVFGLILFNNFITESSSANRSLSDTGESIALSSVSGLLTNQLNNLADRYVQGVDISFGLESYKSQFINDGTGGAVTELQVGISKQFFNDRLTIRVGGNVNVEGEGTGGFENANFSDIAGDFVLSYKLTPSGNYRLRVFRKSNFDVLQQENDNRTGVGFLFTKSFGDKTKKVKRETGDGDPEGKKEKPDGEAVRPSKEEGSDEGE